MTVEIWSDVMCPFCYIGKRRFEAALAQFPQREQVQVTWKSFQLDPTLVTDPSKTVLQSLAEKKGLPLPQVRQMMAHAVNMALEVGLHYDFDRAVVANSFDAHRLSHLALRHGVQDAVEERLFAAYFMEGKNTADYEVLTAIGAEAGLDADEVQQVLSSDAYAGDVRRDIAEARQLGIQGVPFFVFERKYAVSGAQAEEVFRQVLERALPTS